MNLKQIITKYLNKFNKEYFNINNDKKNKSKGKKIKIKIKK